MTPPHDATTVIASLALINFVTGIALWFLPVGTCSECDHCQRQRSDAAAQRQLSAHRAFHRQGVDQDPNCPHCDRSGRPKE